MRLIYLKKKIAANKVSDNKTTFLEVKFYLDIHKQQETQMQELVHP